MKVTVYSYWTYDVVNGSMRQSQRKQPLEVIQAIGAEYDPASAESVDFASLDEFGCFIPKPTLH